MLKLAEAKEAFGDVEAFNPPAAQQPKQPLIDEKSLKFGTFPDIAFMKIHSTILLNPAIYLPFQLEI